MKKWIIPLWCLLLSACLAFSVHAASAQMQIGVSSGTVYRGDTVTVTVKLNNSSPVSNGGIVLKYDNNLFSFDGGSCSASSNSDINSKGGVFVLETDKVVSGTIFTFKLKVKSDAKFGTTSLSGSGNLDSASGDISCGVSGTSLTIACKHDYKNYTSIDGNQHQCTCSVCGDVKKENHSWNAGTVTKAASCKETGSRLLTCTACKAEKTETIAKTEDHKYSSYAKLDDNHHTAVCTVCQQKFNLAHNWNKGKMIKEPTCQETGSRTLTCKACSTTKEETVQKAAHTFTPWESVDETNHTHSCTVCQKTETKAHKFGKELLHDKATHFTGCQDCTFAKDHQEHVPGPEATATTDQICTVCERVLQIRTDHDHELAEGWSSDQEGHWNICNLCEQKCNFTAHSYETNCQEECTICDFKRTPPHDPDGTWAGDQSGHWQLCKECGIKISNADHTPGAAATTASPQLCTDCGYELAPVLPHDHFDAGHSHICECGETYNAAEDCPICEEFRKEFPWWILCVAEAVVFAAAAGIYFYLKKKKQMQPTL